MPSMSFAYRDVKRIVDIPSIHSYRAAMSEEKDPRIITPMPQKLVDAIDDYRFTNRLASRAEAIRQLIELGLKAAETPAKTKA